MTIILAILGVIGMMLCVGAYWALQNGKLKAEEPKYYIINCTGAICILVSLAYDFDLGDLGGVLLEVAWILISLFGFIKYKRGNATS